jgi:hypothetical protein
MPQPISKHCCELSPLVKRRKMLLLNNFLASLREYFFSFHFPSTLPLAYLCSLSDYLPIDRVRNNQSNPAKSFLNHVTSKSNPSLKSAPTMGHELLRSCSSAEMDKSYSSNEIYGSSVRMVYHSKLTPPRSASFDLKLIWIVYQRCSGQFTTFETESLSCLIQYIVLRDHGIVLLRTVMEIKEYVHMSKRTM